MQGSVVRRDVDTGVFNPSCVDAAAPLRSDFDDHRYFLLEGDPTMDSELHQRDERFLTELRARPRTALDASVDPIVEAVARWRQVARCAEAALGDGEAGFRATACGCREQAAAAERRGQELDLWIAVKWRELAERYEQLVTPLSRSG